MANIHPTALVNPGAELGADCEIGPYCVIGGSVVLGPRCRLHSHVVMDGHTRIGAGNEFYPFASIGLKTQDLKWKGGVTRLEIGDHNVIRESVTIHSATGDGESTVIGSHNTILAGSHVGHNVTLGNHVIISMAAVAGHVVVEDYALIGGLSAVHQFCRVGRMAIVGGLTAIAQDVPPFMLVNGNPALTRTINKVGLERRGVSKEAQGALRQAYRILYREGLSIPNALARIENELGGFPEITQLVGFVRGSERGICK